MLPISLHCCCHFYCTIVAIFTALTLPFLLYFLIPLTSIPVITDFTDENGVDTMKEQIQLNYNRIKEEAKQIVADELERIKKDPALAHLLQQDNQ